MAKKYDFSGYATRANVRCADGRTILKDAFKDNDGETIPLVWNHLHDSPDNILGHALLENREDGVYVYGSFNDTDYGQKIKKIVEHGDITNISIYANRLVEKNKTVIHGMIREVSLVLAGANPGAKIETLALQHDEDGSVEYIEDEAVIFTDSAFEVNNQIPEVIVHADPEDDEDDEDEDDDDEETVGDIFETLTDKQKTTVYALIGQAMKASTVAHNDNLEGDNTMKYNVFSDPADADVGRTLTHDEFSSIVTSAVTNKGMFKQTLLEHAGTYGIDNIEVLFPDARNVTPTPDFITREMNWVEGVLSACRHSPFSRIKSVAADITADEARAKGYIKGNRKKEEVINLLKRITTPQTIYKKQKLDRDDIIDITDMDVVAWLWAEMRVMLKEELARAILVGDGREADDPDRIRPENIRPIYLEDDLYAHHVVIGSTKTTTDIIEQIIRNRVNYKGSGTPTFYTTSTILADMLLLTDTIGHRLYKTEAELASVLRVSKIVEVPVMENLTRTMDDSSERDLIGIIVNLSDYTIGTDKGGEITTFDDFDIDFNQYKYLLETRLSGALIHPQSALVIEKAKA